MLKDNYFNRLRFLAVLAFLSVLFIAAPAALAQSSLESPQQGSFESGIGLIRGWVCEASTVEVVIDQGTASERRLATAYPSRRQDTAGVCGDSDNGFGLTVPWYAFGDGLHNLRALADGVEFANVNFVATTLGGDFLTGLSGDFPLSNFPNSGDTTTIGWSEPHQNFVIKSNVTVPSVPTPPSVAQAFLESPQQGSFESGIGLIRGWVCEASTVEVVIDQGTASERRLATAYPSRRQDTESQCGDADNGFGLIVPWYAFGNGVHNLRALADGVEFANVNFAVTALGGDFLTGLSGDFPLSDFPNAGNTTTVRWSEPHQNFVISTSTATGAKVALITALLDQSNPFGAIATNPSNFSDLFGVRVSRASDGRITGLQSVDWSDLDAGLWTRLLLGLNGLPEQYRDSQGVEARFANYTDNSVEVTFFDRNGALITGPLTLPLNQALLGPLQGLLPRLNTNQHSQFLNPNLLHYNNINLAAATLDPFTVELTWSAGIALGEMLCQVAEAGVEGVVASSGCAAPVVSGFEALANAPGRALDPSVQQALRYSRDDIVSAPCNALEDSNACLQVAKEELEEIESPETGGEPPPKLPDVPTNVLASDGTYAERVSITWNAVADATFYEVYRSDTPSSNGTQIGQSSSTAFDDTAVTAGNSHWYSVRACNDAGCGNFSAADEGYRAEIDLQEAKWGVLNGSCCSGSSSTLSVTIDGVTRRSNLPACGSPGEASWSGFATTSAGAKSFSANATAAACQDYSFSGNVDFAASGCYLFQSTVENGQPRLTFGSVSCSSSSLKQMTSDDTKSLKKLDDASGAMPKSGIWQSSH